MALSLSGQPINSAAELIYGCVRSDYYLNIDRY